MEQDGTRVATLSDVLNQLFGISVEELKGQLKAYQDLGHTAIAIALPIPRFELFTLPVVIRDDIKEATIILDVEKQENQDDEVQTPPLPSPIRSDKDEQDSSGPSPTLGDGDRKDGRIDQHPKDQVRDGVKEYSDPISTRNSIQLEK